MITGTGWKSWVIHFDLPVRESRIKEIEEMMVADNFWNDQRKAQSLVQEMNTQKNLIKENTVLILMILVLKEMNWQVVIN